MQLAAEFLRPGAGEAVQVVEGADEGNGLKLQIRGYPRSLRPIEVEGSPAQTSGMHMVDPLVVADIFRLLRGHSNLIFAGSRQRVEAYSDALRERCEEERVPNEFFAHHGNLAKDERENVEDRLRQAERPSTAIATSTLELGIDLGTSKQLRKLVRAFPCRRCVSAWVDPGAGREIRPSCGFSSSRKIPTSQYTP